MESSHFYQLLRQQLGCYSSLAAQSTHGSVAAIHEWNPSLHLNNYDYDRYMNEILPNSVELLTKSANFPNMEFDECKSCPNPSTVQSADDINENDGLITSFSSNDQVYKHQFSDSHLYYSNKASWACPAASSSNNYVFAADSSNLGLSTSCLDSTHLAIDFTSYLNNGEKYCTRLPKENLIDPSYSQSSSSSNKTIECRNKATSKTKRVLSTSSQRRSSHDEAAKKRRAVSQSLPKVGKEKIGDRIAALHRLVAPFGKTDAASVLTEAIGYIQFLHDQIQTLSMPCIKSSHNEGRRCFQGVFSNQNQKEIDAKQDLRNRGLCLVPSSIASYISSSCAGLDGI